MTHLAIVMSEIAAAPDGVRLADKTLSGMSEFLQRWHGPVTVVGRPVSDDGGNLGVRAYSFGEIFDQFGFAVRLGDPVAILSQLRPDVMQISLTYKDRDLQKLGIPHVVVAENPAIERFRYAAPTVARSSLPRMAVGAARQELRQRQMVRAADGLACNGWAAWDAYQGVARRRGQHPVFFVDSRVRRADVDMARRSRAAGDSTEPLRLAFSGRLHPAKGPQFAVAASRLLDEWDVPHTLDILGDGPLRAQLEEAAGGSVRFHGSVAFDPHWMDFVRERVDLMVLPHVQGDPSGTYIESAAMGAPVVGFDNAALRGHERRGGFAWTVRVGDTVGLARLIQRLSTSRAERQSRAQAGLDFGERFGVEAEFTARAQQLEEVAARRLHV